MRHRVQSKRFGRSPSHRAALFSGLVCALIRERKITTTVAKARFVRMLAEKMVTLAKSATLSARRRAFQVLKDRRLVSVLFGEIGPSYKDRKGGYCRIVKIGQRRSDCASLAIIEWVGLTQIDRRKKEKTAEEKKKE